jgi:hypothetical protein
MISSIHPHRNPIVDQNPTLNTTDMIAYGINMNIHKKLFGLIIAVTMKLSTQACLGIGCRMYGFISWAGVCCAIKRNRKSTQRMNGASEYKNS